MKLRMLLLNSATLLALAVPAAAQDPDLLVFDWAGFEDPALTAAYAAKYGASPTYASYADEEEAFQKVSSGFKVDVSHPCSASVQRYKDAGLLEPWDVSKIPEFANIDPQFLNSTIFKDDQGVWYIPTDYAYTAIAYNTEEVPAEDVASLNVFIDPKYQGRVSLPDNNDDTWSLAFLATGVTDWTNVTDEQFKAAADWLRLAHQNVRAYWADPGEMSQLMATGEVLVSWSWNDGVTLLKEEGYPVGFNRTPKEGVATWYCGYVNFKDAPGSEEKAYDFINAWLSPEGARALLDGFGYAHANTKSLATIPAEELVAASVDPVNGTLLSQTPISNEMRDRMIKEFDNIKAGF